MVILDILKTFKKFLETQINLTKMFILMEVSILTYNSLNKNVQYYLNLICQNSFIPIISKPTKVTRKPATIINHNLINLFVNTNFKTFILKIDISDHFPIFLLQPTSRPREENKATYNTKTVINNTAIDMFKQELYRTN